MIQTDAIGSKDSGLTAIILGSQRSRSRNFKPGQNINDFSGKVISPVVRYRVNEINGLPDKAEVADLFKPRYSTAEPVIDTKLTSIIVNDDIDISVPDFLLKAEEPNIEIEKQNENSLWLRVPVGRSGPRKTVERVERLFYPGQQVDTPAISANIPDLENRVFDIAKKLCSSPEEVELVRTVREIASKLNQVHSQTFHHSLRVAYLTHKFGETLNLNKEELLRRLLGAILHDIGKMDPKILEVIDLPRALSPDERAIVNKHPDFGFQMAKDQNISDRSVSLLEILQHHMWLVQQRGGYPKRAPGEDISPEASALHLPDVYDAITGEPVKGVKARAYRDPAQPIPALKVLIRGEGIEFEQALVEKFVALMGYDYFDLRDEVRTDEHVLKGLLREAGTVYDNAAVEKLIKRNEYNIFDLKKEIEFEEQVEQAGSRFKNRFAMSA